MKPAFISLSLASTVLAILLSPPTSVFSQATGPDKATLKAQLDIREKRADLVLSELRAADDRIEDTIDHVLDTLKLVGDSKDSRTKVARLKEQTIGALQKNIAFYQQKRAGMLEELRRPTLHLTVEEKQRYVAKLDARIEKRVQQVLEVAKSMPTHKDYEQYTPVAGAWGGTNMVLNEDYKQNRRLTLHTDGQRDDILKGLQRSIDKIDQQNRSLQAQIPKATNPAYIKMLQEEMAKNDALLKTRRAQIYEMQTSMETVTRPVSGKEAQNLDMSLRRTVDTLRRDFTTLFGRISSYITERSSVNAAKAALEAVK
jgi:hypothetical protein